MSHRDQDADLIFSSLFLAGTLLVAVIGVPGRFCTSGGETNWYGRSHEWHEESGTLLSRS